jgi:prolyl-tRNA editing enzyme YbaK/EbsC (Cys-tRNA(Pro) deacylase)
VDVSLTVDKEIIFNAGTHADAIRINFTDFVRLAQPKVCLLAARARAAEQ